MFKNLLQSKQLRKALTIKNRLIIINEDTFEELFSFKLSVLNVFVASTLGAIFLIIATTVLIAFTPLREYIPGYSSSNLKKEAMLLALKTDSLAQALDENETYLKAIQNVLTGKLEHATFNKDSILAQSHQNNISSQDLKASEEELELRDEVAKEDKNSKKSLASKKK